MKNLYKDALIKMKDQDNRVEESSKIKKKLEDQVEMLYKKIEVLEERVKKKIELLDEYCKEMDQITYEVKKLKRKNCKSQKERDWYADEIEWLGKEVICKESMIKVMKRKDNERQRKYKYKRGSN